MIGLIKDLLGPKAGIRMVIRTTLLPQTVLDLEKIVRSYGMLGWIQAVRGRHTMIELEGPKAKLQSLMIRLQQSRWENQPTILEVTWLPYEKKFEVFRVSM